jgi:hypothetical protein
MGEPESRTEAAPSLVGIPPGLVGEVIGILQKSAGPIRRRKLLSELEQRGRRISLAGLNRILQYCVEAGLTVETPEGVQLRAGTR